MSDNNDKISFFKSVGGKLITNVILLGVLIIIVISSASVIIARNSLFVESKNKLQAVVEIKRNQLRSYFLDKTNLIIGGAESMDIQLAVSDLIKYHDEMDIQTTADYDTTGNSKDLTKTYNQIYTEANKMLKKYNDVYGFYDVFIICAKHGHVMYTNTKEADFGTNLATGKYNDSNLADLWKKVLKSNKPEMVDFASYAPSNGDAAMFLGAPIKDTNGQIRAVLAVQISVKEVDQIMTEKTGMGESGETYLVGRDKLMRSNSRFEANTILKKQIDTKSVDEIIKDKEGYHIIKDYRDIYVLSQYSHMGFDEDFGTDFDWGIIGEIDKDEVNKPVVKITWIIIILSLVIIAVLFVVTFIFSRSISKPIIKITNLMKNLSKGDLEKKEININSKDEIGLLANMFKIMTKTLREKSGVLEKIAAGDLRVNVKLVSEKDALGISMLKMTKSLNSVLGQVSSNVVQVNSGANQIATASQTLSQGATEQARLRTSSATTAKPLPYFPALAASTLAFKASKLI